MNAYVIPYPEAAGEIQVSRNAMTVLLSLHAKDGLTSMLHFLDLKRIDRAEEIAEFTEAISPVIEGALV